MFFIVELSVCDFDIVEEVQVPGCIVRRIWLRCSAAIELKSLQHYSIWRTHKHPATGPSALVKDTLDAFTHYMHAQRDDELCEAFSCEVFPHFIPHTSTDSIIDIASESEGYSTSSGIKIVYTLKHSCVDLDSFAIYSLHTHFY